MEKLDKSAGQSMDIVADNIAKLKELFPEILTENKIDFKVLEALLGEEIEVKDERYSFNWHGKSQARRLAQSPSTGTLRPCQEESLDWDETQNLFIEGDNLEVLKLLQKSYHKQVKMIYIDPPYNTGKDFVYPDNFHDNIQNYLELTGQMESSRKIGTNAEASGRYHTDWLNMMYPRLKLARNLLLDDGVILISIDDHEVANLRNICDEIFGVENFIAQLVWKKKYTGGQHSKFYADFHEYILVYGKNSNLIGEFGVERTEEESEKFTESDEFSIERGKFYSRPLKSNLEERKTLIYPITMPDGSFIETQWLIGKDRFIKELNEKRVFFKQKINGEWQVYKKYYQFDGGGKTKPSSLIERFPNTEAKNELKKLFGISEGRDNVFYTVKPINLLKYLFEPYLNDSDICIDFFAGSGTTGHVVYEMNIADNNQRKFILVQLPEPMESNYRKISDLTKDRLKRASTTLKKDNPNYQGDLGFKVFKLDSSNLKSWDADFDSLAQDLAEATEVVKADRKPEDILFEILLKYGLNLTLPIGTHSIAGKKVYEVGAGALIVCLDDGVTEAVAEGIGKLKEQLEPEVMRVVFKDSSFASDTAKVNAVQVLKQYGIDDVKSI